MFQTRMIKIDIHANDQLSVTTLYAHTYEAPTRQIYIANRKTKKITQKKIKSVKPVCDNSKRVSLSASVKRVRIVDNALKIQAKKKVKSIGYKAEDTISVTPNKNKYEPIILKKMKNIKL